MPTKWTEQELALVKEHYVKPDGFKILKELLPHRGYNSIKGCANDMGIIRRPDYIKNNFFFTIPNDINCWAAGFIAADGYIHLPKQRFHMELAEKDIEYLIVLKDAMGYNGKVYTRQPKLKRVTLKTSGKEYTIGKNKVCVLLVSCASQWISDLDRNWNITTQKPSLSSPLHSPISATSSASYLALSTVMAGYL